jgi:hypothetical protein
VSSEKTNPAGTLTLTFHSPEQKEDETLSFNPLSLWYFVVAAQAEEH